MTDPEKIPLGTVYQRRIFLVLVYIAIMATANLFYFIGRSSLHWW